LEAVVDRISLERHPLSKNAKDFGSAAVALAIALAMAAWAVVLYNRYL
jgi:diacylglycerol kinase (ATP)